MVNVNERCLNHYTRRKKRCMLCALPLDSKYILHHTRDNGQEHALFIVEQNPELRTALFGGEDNDNTRSRLGQTIRTWLVKNNFKTDKEFPLIVVCNGCHAFLHRKHRVPTLTEAADYHHEMAGKHTNALSYLISNPDHNTITQKNVITLENFNDIPW